MTTLLIVALSFTVVVLAAALVVRSSRPAPTSGWAIPVHPHDATVHGVDPAGVEVSFPARVAGDRRLVADIPTAATITAARVMLDESPMTVTLDEPVVFSGAGLFEMHVRTLKLDPVP